MMVGLATDARDAGTTWSWRMVPPAYSPMSGRALLAGLRSAFDGEGVVREMEVEDRLARRFSADAVLLTACGTDALTLALEAAMRRSGCRRVALPAYTCFSVATAAASAAAHVLLYDVDPETLSPDLESVERTLRAGAKTVVVAHLYGYPADVPDVVALAEGFGATVIEDAAQSAGGVLRGAPVGALAPLSVLSFGRGKGTSCGCGGALLVRDTKPHRWIFPGAREFPLRNPIAGRDVVVAFGQWALGGRHLYGLAASLPFLGLGETRYHAPRAPRPMSRFAVGVLHELFGSQGMTQELDARRRNASELAKRLAEVDGLWLIRPVAGAEPGALRFPFLLATGAAEGEPSRGIVRGYPTPLSEIQPFRRFLLTSTAPTPGAELLASCLYTAPTHSQLTVDSLRGIEAWVREHSLEARPSPALVLEGVLAEVA